MFSLDKKGTMRVGTLNGKCPRSGHFGALERVSAWNPESSVGPGEGGKYQGSELLAMTLFWTWRRGQDLTRICCTFFLLLICLESSAKQSTRLIFSKHRASRLVTERLFYEYLERWTMTNIDIWLWKEGTLLHFISRLSLTVPLQFDSSGSPRVRKVYFAKTIYFFLPEFAALGRACFLNSYD